MEEIVKKEQEIFSSYNNLIEGLIEGTKETLNDVSQNISNEVKKSSYDTAGENDS